MRKFFKKILTPLLAVTMSLSLGVVAKNGTSENLSAKAAPSSITINANDTFSPALHASNSGYPETPTAHTHTPSDKVFEAAGVYKLAANSYIMFVQNKGYWYNSSNLGFVSKVSITYSGGTSTTGKIGVYFGDSVQSTYTTTNNQTIAGLNMTDTFTNATTTYGYFQISTSNKNVQITQIVIEYDDAGVTPSVLTGLQMNKTTAEVVKGFTEQLSVTPVPSDANPGTITWTSSNQTIATVSADGLVSALVAGQTTITATSSVDPDISATCDVTVINPYVYSKVTTMSGVQFGATYTLGALGTKAMSNVVSANSVAEYDAHYTAEENLIRENITLKFVLEPGVLANTYALKVVGTEKYLGAVSNTSNNYLRQLVDKDYLSSFTISFDTDTGDAIFSVVITQTVTKTIRYNKTHPRFSTYASGQTAVQLFVDPATQTAANEAASFANDVWNGQGANANGSCNAIYGALSSAYNRLGTDAKTIVDTSSDALYVNARARMAYLEAWDTLNPSSPLAGISKTNTTLSALAIITLLGISVIALYYFFIRKKRYN